VLLPADGLALTPLVIVAVAVSYVTSARLAPALAWAATSRDGLRGSRVVRPAGRSRD
jgi:hypothetical protein